MSWLLRILTAVHASSTWLTILKMHVMLVEKIFHTPTLAVLIILDGLQITKSSLLWVDEEYITMQSSIRWRRWTHVWTNHMAFRDITWTRNVDNNPMTPVTISRIGIARCVWWKGWNTKQKQMRILLFLSACAPAFKLYPPFPYLDHT